jgi:hypothetical protein
MRQDFFGWIEKPDAVSGNAAITAARWPLSGLAAAHDYEKSAPHDGTTVGQRVAGCPGFVHDAGGLHESPADRGFLHLSGVATPDKCRNSRTGVTGGADVAPVRRADGSDHDPRPVSRPLNVGVKLVA